jgi:hypothetical protein
MTVLVGRARPSALVALASLGLAGACTRPSESRAEAELAVGAAEAGGTSVSIAGALAAVRGLSDRRLELWSQAPVLEIALDVAPAAAGDWELVIHNALPDAALDVDGTPIAREPAERPTIARFRVPLAGGAHALVLAPPDAALAGPYRVAAMADIQTALPEVDDVFRAISAVPDVRFVIGMGDITERARIEEYELYERQLATLRVPFYTTLGNHELWASPDRWFERFGRASFQFRFKGVAFTFVDSGDAAIDPLVEEWLDGWLDGARDETHVFLTHFPAIDPLGVRYGGMRSVADGQRLLSRLARGAVDLTRYGHIHTSEAFENAGIPAYISGGGGAEPMRGDGIDRHFLMIEVGPDGIGGVELHRVD